MKEEFDLNRIGKKMPYTTPQGLWNEMDKNVWEVVKHDMAQASLRRRCRILYTLSSGLVAAGIALFVVFQLTPHREEAPNMEQLEQAFLNLNPTDQNYLINVYQDDLFLNDN